MTLLERWDIVGAHKGGFLEHEIRRAIAVAQAAEEEYQRDQEHKGTLQRYPRTAFMLMRRADELLKEKQ